MLQGQRDVEAVSQLIMSELTALVGAHQGAFYLARAGEDGRPVYELAAGYGMPDVDGKSSWRVGEGLVGQAAVERRPILLEDIPADRVRVRSGLFDAVPNQLVVLPVLFEEQVLAVIELASLKAFGNINRSFLEQIVETVGVVINTILATMRTEELLAQSQGLTQELQSQSEELQRQQAELRHTNAEIELARRELEDRAEQLALSSRYKTEFLANMSHELRTPLNSLLILAKLLADNTEGNLTERQVEFARSISDAGNDLLALISDILDLSKVEAGKMDIAFGPAQPQDICLDLEHTFRPIAEQQELIFTVEIAEGAPGAMITDEHRVQQILKNLLSNACKFTDEGRVTLRVAPTTIGAGIDAVAFSVIDTGIGIDSNKLLLIFEAFQQADGTTSRRYGGTGLGLSISREMARLLKGEIRVESEPGQGSTFTLVLPVAPDTVPAPRKIPIDVVAKWGTPPSDREWPQLRGKRILVVDDDVRNVYALASALEQHGVDVVTAGNGREAVDALSESHAVDLVLLDVMMPELDGYETAEAIREFPQFQELPIIMLTAKAMQGDRDASLAAGASDYITKPVDIDRLLDTVCAWLAR
jgi:signal transduction histidine kinase